MNVLHMVSTPERRGAQVFATQLVGTLDERFVSVIVAVEGSPSSGGLHVPNLASSRWDPQGFRRLLAYVREADVVVGHGSSTLLHGAAAALLGRRPFVYRNIGDPRAWGTFGSPVSAWADR